MLNLQELTGQTSTHVTQNVELRFVMHPLAAEAFLDLRSSAAAAGFDLQIISSFRDFSTQLRIWNQKYRGERPILDASGVLIDRENLADWDLIQAILGWSALPGASRHHWGSDIDVFDASRASREQVQLVPSEYDAGGVFQDLHRWLDQNIANFGFFKPYESFLGGIQPEPWHLSFRPVAEPALEDLSLELLEETLRGQPLAGKDVIQSRLDAIYSRFIVNINSPA